MSRFVTALLASSFAAACGGSTVAPRPIAPVAPAPTSTPAVSPAPPPPSCDDVLAPVLWEAVPVAEHEGLDQDEHAVARIELDGAAPAEAVLSVNHVPEELAGEDSRSLMWVLGCAGGAWSVLGKHTWDIDDAWDGFYDGPPGIAVLRAETVPGVDHPMLRVEVVNLRGSYDPRYSLREFDLFHLAGGALVQAFRCETHAEQVAGPDRDVVRDRLRTVIYGGGTPARIHVVVTGSEGDRSIRTVRGDYVWQGNSFVAGEDYCGR